MVTNTPAPRRLLRAVECDHRLRAGAGTPSPPAAYHG